MSHGEWDGAAALAYGYDWLAFAHIVIALAMVPLSVCYRAIETLEKDRWTD